MSRLLINVEGETEETFVNEVLAAHLYTQGYERVGARLIGNARLRVRRGGIRSWTSVRDDVVRQLHGDAGVVVTTMVDYYALPRTGDKAWPGRDAAAGYPFPDKAPCVEAALREDVTKVMGKNFNQHRFVPFVIMHEFEGLLFSDCEAFSRGIARPELRDQFQAIRDGFDTPEEINDSPYTAPSKRVIAIIPNYEKPILGSLAALEIGLAAIRHQCPHFNGWLEQLAQSARL
jgi:uncharacterized protein DUF4276